MGEKLASFFACNFIQARDPTNALVEALFPSVEVKDPLKRVLINEDLDWDLSSDEEEIEATLRLCS